QFGPVNDVVIHQNLFRNNNAGTPSQSGDGIFTSACQNVTISGNTFTGNFRLSAGINNSSGVTISDNVADQETRFVVFTGTTHASVVNNTGTNLVATVPGGGFTDPSQPSYVLVGPGN